VWSKLLLLLLVVFLPGTALAASAEELFADGNRLFRDDLYWAALLRYREARHAGLDTPLLHYNMGVAHYKAGQYTRARESLLEAAGSAPLEVHAHYNLGLNAWAMGNTDEALDWFRLARDQARFPPIASLAEAAIARIQRELAAERQPVLARAEAARPGKQPLGLLDFQLAVGAGNDNNVFRTPGESYVDQSDPNAPVVDPLVQSGFFVPVALKAKYSINTFDNEAFFLAYRFGGRFYPDTNLENGNEYAHELSVGSEYRKRAGNRERVIFSAFSFAQHDETYYDRDNGGVVTVGGEEIGARLNYRRYGPEIWFRQSFERFSFGARGKAQLWNYDETTVVPEYDHQYALMGLNAQYRFTRTSLLRLTADAYSRHFGARPSFELDGTQPPGNEPVKYDYLALGISARQRISRNMWIGLNYVRTDRADRHVAYNDYTRNSFSAEFHLDLGSRFDLDAEVFNDVYDYPNAFAFHNPAAGRKTLDRIGGGLAATFRMTRSLSLVGNLEYQDIASNDTRLAYNRSQFALSVRWEH
jgi:hypothetical protein